MRANPGLRLLDDDTVTAYASEKATVDIQLDGPPERPTSSAFLTTAEVWLR